MKKRLLTKACAAFLSMALLFNGNAITSFANAENEFSNETVTEDASQNEDANFTNIGFSLDELKNSPALTEDYQEGVLKTADAESCFHYAMDESGYFQINFKPGDNVKSEDIKNGWKIELFYEDLEDPIFSDSITSTYTSPYLSMGQNNVYVVISCDYNFNDGFCPLNQPFNIKAISHHEANWESENNNTVATAMPLKETDTYKGNIYTANDVDYYKYTTTKEGYFTINFSSDPQLAITEKLGHKWNFIILDSNGETLHEYTGTASSTSYKLAYHKDSVFYIRIQACDTYLQSLIPLFQPYNLSVSFTECDNWESEDNDTTETANFAALNKEMNGCINSTDDKDFYSIEVSKAEEVNFDFKLTKQEGYDNSQGVDISVLDSNGKEIEKFDGVCSKEAFSYNAKFKLSKGKNFIKIENTNSYGKSSCLGSNYSFTIKDSNSPTPNPSPNPNPDPTPNGNYTVSYNGLDGVTFDKDIFITSYPWSKKMKAIKLPTKKQLTKPGFTFKGWYNTTTKKKVTKITKKTANNTTFEAKWKENRYSVKYITKTGVNTKCKLKVKSSKQNYTEEFTLATTLDSNTNSFNGYYIAGWTTHKNSNEIEYTTNQKVSKLATKNNAKVKLYAVWKQING